MLTCGKLWSHAHKAKSSSFSWEISCLVMVDFSSNYVLLFDGTVLFRWCGQMMIDDDLFVAVVAPGGFAESNRQIPKKSYVRKINRVRARMMYVYRYAQPVPPAVVPVPVRTVPYTVRYVTVSCKHKQGSLSILYSIHSSLFPYLRTDVYCSSVWYSRAQKVTYQIFFLNNRYGIYQFGMRRRPRTPVQYHTVPVQYNNKNVRYRTVPRTLLGVQEELIVPSNADRAHVRSIYNRN